MYKFSLGLVIFMGIAANSPFPKPTAEKIEACIGSPTIAHWLAHFPKDRKLIVKICADEVRAMRLSGNT